MTLIIEITSNEVTTVETHQKYIESVLYTTKQKIEYLRTHKIIKNKDNTDLDLRTIRSKYEEILQKAKLLFTNKVKFLKKDSNNTTIVDTTPEEIRSQTMDTSTRSQILKNLARPDIHKYRDIRRYFARLSTEFNSLLGPSEEYSDLKKIFLPAVLSDRPVWFGRRARWFKCA